MLLYNSVHSLSTGKEQCILLGIDKNLNLLKLLFI